MIISHLHAAPEAQGRLQANLAQAFAQKPIAALCELLRERVEPVRSATSCHRAKMREFADCQGSQGDNFNEDDLGAGTRVTVDEGLTDFAVFTDGIVLGSLKAASLMNPLGAIVHESDDSVGLGGGKSSSNAGFNVGVHGHLLRFGNSHIGHNVRIGNGENVA